MVDFSWEGKVSLNGSEVNAIVGALLIEIDKLEVQFDDQINLIKNIDNDADKLMAINNADSTASALLMRKNLVKRLDC